MNDSRIYLPSLVDTKSVVPMSKKLSEVFLQATLIEMHKGFDEWTQAVARDMGRAATLMWHRMIGFTCNNNPAKIGVSAAIVVVMQIETPGDAVLWGFTLNRIWNQKGPVTMQTLADAFPMGFPGEEGKQEIWDAQKCSNWGYKPGHHESDNLLDHPHKLTDTENFIEKKEWCKWLAL